MKVLVRLGNVVGVYFVPDNHVAVVMRFGRYNRVQGPGYIRIMPIIESLGPLVSTGFRFESFIFENVLSRDGIPLVVYLKVGYRFDPSRTRCDIASQLVQCSAEILKVIVNDMADNSVRQILGNLWAEEACCGEFLSRIQYQIQHELSARLRPMGLSPMRNGGVMIRGIVRPQELLKIALEAERHKTTLEALDSYGDSKVKDAITAEWVNNDSANNGVFPPFLPFLDFWGFSGITRGNGSERSEAQSLDRVKESG